jgi:hypothetical protein
MIKLINNSTNRKTGAIATTYRAGGRDVFSTCPNTCALKPIDKHGSNKIDQVYLKALKSAVVRGGGPAPLSVVRAKLSKNYCKSIPII